MKAVVTLVQVAESQDEIVLAAVRATRDHLREAEAQADKIGKRLEAAKGAAEMRRLELGKALVAARDLWPSSRAMLGGARGPGGVTWLEWLAIEGIAESTADRYMKATGWTPSLTTLTEPDSQVREPDPPDDDHGQYGAKDPILPRAADAELPPFRALTRADLVQAFARLPPEERKLALRDCKATANVAGGSGEVARGPWCTPKALALAVGSWDLDPFSNQRSHVAAAKRCMLEDGGDGFGDGSGPGSYRVRSRDAEYADATTRVWLQPPYEIVLDVVDHYKHTRFAALLRWAPDTRWFAALWPYVLAVAFPRGERLEFEPPEGVEASSNPYPHAIYYACQHDITDEIRATCIVWLVNHSSDPLPVDPAA